MTAPDDDDLDLLAGEYALGVLDLAERRDIERVAGPSRRWRPPSCAGRRVSRP